MKFWTSMMGYPEKRDLRKIRGCPETRQKNIVSGKYGTSDKFAGTHEFLRCPVLHEYHVLLNVQAFLVDPFQCLVCPGSHVFLLGSYIKLGSSLNFFVLP